MANPNNKPTSSARTASPVKSPPVAQDGRDEIEQIMDEIEMLQQEIDSAELTPPTKTAAQAAPVAVKAANPVARQQAQAPASAKAQAPAAAPNPEPMPEPMNEPVNELEELGFGTGGGDSSLEETLADLKEEPSSGNGALDQPVSRDDEVPEELDEEVVEEETVEEETAEEANFEEEEEESPMSTSPSKSQSPVSHPVNHPINHNEPEDTTGAAADGSLTMTLKGSMTLNLQYDCDGQTVTVGFSDGALRVQLADGTEFKIPMRAQRGGNLRRIA